MTTVNPYDDLNKTIIRRAKKVDKALSAGIEIAKRIELTTQKKPQIIKALRSTNYKVSQVCDMFEPDPMPESYRRDEVIYYMEISKEEALKLSSENIR